MRRTGGYIELVANMGTVAIGAMVVLLASALPGIVDAQMAEHTFTIRTASHSSAMESHLRRGYVEDAAGWTMHAATYTQGQIGGGQEDWTVGTIPSEDDIEDWLEEEATRVFREDYLGGPFPRSLCRIDVGGEMTVRERLLDRGKMGILYIYDHGGQPPTVNCTAITGARQVAIPVQREQFARENRYFALYRNVTAALEDIADAWGDDVQDTYTATGDSRCGGTSQDAIDNAEDNAETDGEQDIERIRDDALSPDHPNSTDFEISEKRVSVDFTTVSTEDPSSSDCCPPGEYNDSASNNCNVALDTEYLNAEATVSPNSVGMRFGIRDRTYGIPTADGNTSLEFVVPTFGYSFE